MSQNEPQIKNIKEYVAESAMKHTSKYNNLVYFLKNHTPDIQDVNECTNNGGGYSDCSGWAITKTSRDNNSFHSCSKCKKFYCEICIDHFMLYNKQENSYVCINCVPKNDFEITCGRCQSSKHNKVLSLDGTFKQQWCLYCDSCKFIIDKY